MWSVFGGLIGARLYHVVTAWELFADDLGRIPMMWNGGLGIPGGLLGGTVAGILVVKRRQLSLPAVLTAAAPGIPLAQAIGRWGNWWNQELFGRPTTLPWGMETSSDNIPPGLVEGTLFHPTFLYESLWSLALCLALLGIDRYRPLRPGALRRLPGRLLPRPVLDRRNPNRRRTPGRRVSSRSMGRSSSRDRHTRLRPHRRSPLAADVSSQSWRPAMHRRLRLRCIVTPVVAPSGCATIDPLSLVLSSRHQPQHGE